MLKNDTALITGAAGGIGRKIIEIFFSKWCKYNRLYKKTK